MVNTPADTVTTSEIAIFARLLSNAKGVMSPRLARYVLTLGFSDNEQARMEDLADRNQRGRTTPDEREQLMSYVKAGHLLALLHSKARKALKSRKDR
ncbi:MAG: hypothetical protein L0215_25015 [Gemmataceae bacterium]|nr:hypothetical protein [Gemmataceae bacterium]